MSIREDFEAWAGPNGYPLKTMGTGEHISYVYGLTGSAFAGYKEATSHQEAKVKALVEALTEITELDASDTEEGFNEWGEAFCFGEAKRIAGEALAAKETP